MKAKTLSPEALAVLSAVEIDGNLARITSGQLDRKLYLEVNAALEALGGKWDRKAKGHVFPADPSDKIDGVVYSGSFTSPKSDFDFFATPTELAERVADEADVKDGQTVLEPSAGHGALAVAVRGRAPGAKITAVEILPENRAVLVKHGFDVLPEGNFLLVGGQTFDRIVMNPPFSGTKGLDHTEHAWGLLAPGGKLVAILPAGVKYRQDKRFKAFRSLVDRHGTMEDLPEGSFKASGTMVRTVLVTLSK